MKREAYSSTKITRLARLLGIEKWGAVGILESIWILAAREAPRGNLGKIADEEIAIGIDWKSDSKILIDALIEARWLDPSENMRFVVHDWSDHADDAVHMRLARSREFFCDGKVPRITRLPKEEKESAKRFYENNKCARRALAVRTACVIRGDSVVLPSLALPKPSQAKPSLNKNLSSPAMPDDDFLVPQDEAEESFAATQDRWFEEEFWPAFWRKVDKASAKKAFRRHGTSETKKTRIVAAARSHASYYLSREEEFRPHAATWLNKLRYEETAPGESATAMNGADRPGHLIPGLLTD